MEKKLNLFDLISIGVGCIVGSGIFALMGFGIAYTGRGITLALFLAMFLCVLQSIAMPLITRVFELEGGEYAINSLLISKSCTGFGVGRDLLFRAGSLAVTAIAVTQYLEMLFPMLSNYTKIVSILVLTIAFFCVLAGDKFAAKVQNIMCIFMYIALALFVFYGIKNFDSTSYSGESIIPNGVGGLVSAIALMSYTCNGFQYVVNMGKSAENPRKNIPLAFCLSALVGAVIYGVIGFAATHTHSFSVIAGMNLGGIAEMIMPHTMYLFFVIGGALFALSTSLVGAIVSGYRPLIACTKDGWLPSKLTKTTKSGTPYVMFLLYLLGAVPILLGMDLGDVATICLFPGAILKIMVNFSAMKIPEKFKKEWKASGISIPLWLYKGILIISSLASVVLGIFYFNSNDLKIAMIGVTVIIALYGIILAKSGKITLHIRDEYIENTK